MTRTILAAALLLGLVACSKRGSDQSRASRSHPAATQSKTGAAPSQPQKQQQKKKGAAKPDTGRSKNPLTNN
ncbi:MAG TPA: hypothetical protein VEU73_06930 [Gemmatimonadales bacterium]|nr:hypothetical protein [Gemmatimonadales bacterium]